jgi:hypothetical protein
MWIKFRQIALFVYVHKHKQTIKSTTKKTQGSIDIHKVLKDLTRRWPHDP